MQRPSRPRVMVLRCATHIETGLIAEQMITSIVVAPYCPPERGGAIALGGAAKQRSLLGGLEACGRVTLLVNSGHQKEGFSATSVRRFGRRTVELHLPGLPWRPLGKLAQAAVAFFLGFRLQRRLRSPMVWIYNSYLFEALYAWGASIGDRAVKIVLELEDMPRARVRFGLGGMKIRLDAWALQRLVGRVAGATIVQQEMRSVLKGVRAIWYLPILLHPQTGNQLVPDRRGAICVGYFGGLAREKGANKLIEVITRSPGHCRWVVCGAGEFAKDMLQLQAADPYRVRFLGAVDDATFREAFNEAQVLVNLHAPLADFGGGIFPFKLLEGVAAGKLVLSTETQGCPAEAAAAIHWLGSDPVEPCLAALHEITGLLERSAAAREQARAWVNGQFRADIAVKRIIAELGV